MDTSLPSLLIVAFFASLAPTITAIAVLVTSINGRHDQKEANKIVDAKQNTIIDKATEIHTLTNSNLSRVTGSLEVAMEKISGLERMIQAMADAKVAKQEKIIVTPESSPTEGKIIVGTFEGPPKNKKP